MANGIDDEDGGVLRFKVDMPVDEVFDQYMIWRLKDTLRFETDPRVRRACHELLSYMSTPVPDND